MKNFDHIKKYENILDKTQEKVDELNDLLEDMLENFDDFKELVEYYHSERWHEDREDDDVHGLMPKDLKRGILSEDAIYNLIVDYYDALELAKELRKRYKSEI